MEYHARHKAGRPFMHACVPHCDGDADKPSMTGVLVLFVDAITGEVLKGDSGTFGGGLHFGNGPSGKLVRYQEGHLTIPSGSLYFFPGYFVTHSVAPMKKSGVIRYEATTYDISTYTLVTHRIPIHTGGPSSSFGIANSAVKINA